MELSHLELRPVLCREAEVGVDFNFQNTTRECKKEAKNNNCRAPLSHNQPETVNYLLETQISICGKKKQSLYPHNVPFSIRPCVILS